MVECQARDLEVRGSNPGPGSNFSLEFKISFISHLEFKIYKTIIMSVVLYGCETWSLTLREECRLTVFETGS